MTFGPIKNFVLLNLSYFMLVVAIGCNQHGTSDSPIDKVNPYYDLKGFFEREIQALETMKPTIVKTISLDEQIEKKELKDVDLRKELDLFIKADINKPAWSDIYLIDSLISPISKRSVLRYRSRDPKQKIQSIEIEFDSLQSPTKIEIQSNVKSAIANTNETLIYYARKGYSIQTDQKVIFGNPTKLRIEVEYHF